MPKTEPTDTMFKPEYEGERPSGALSLPERQTLRLVKAAVVDRLHIAMLTQSVLDGDGPAGIRCAGIPQHLVEFSDRVGEEAEERQRAVFEPTAAQVSDMPKALALLDGLRKPYYTIIKLRALEVFARDQGETSPWPWDKIGQVFGLSARWAEDAYDAAIIQAARRAGVLPMVSQDYGILVAACWVDRGWLTNLSTAADPRAAAANLRVKSPIRPEQSFIIWVAGQPVAKRIVDAVKPELRGLASHGAWFKVHPDVLAEKLVVKARSIGEEWVIEDLPMKGPMAA